MRRNVSLVLLLLTALLLSACDLQVLTEINEDGSGEFGFEMGIPESEAEALAAFEMTPQALCEEAQSEGDLEGATIDIREEDGVTYCLIKAPFADLDELREAYAESDATINTLSCDGEGGCNYDVTIDLSGESADELTEGLDVEINMSWTVTLPGSIDAHNADTQDGNTLTWNLTPGGVINMQAQSSPGGGIPWLWIILGLSCICILALAVGGGGFFFMRQRGK